MAQALTYTPKGKIELPEDALKGTSTWHRTKEEDEVLKRVLYRFEYEMLPAQQQYWQEWDDARKIYECTITPDPLRLRESFKVPWSHTIIDTAVAEEVDAFPDIVIDSSEGEDKQKLPLLNAAKKYALNRASWDKAKQEALRLRRIYGWCAMRIYYSRETRIIKQRKPVKGDNGMMMAYEEVVDYPWDDIRLEVIDNPKRFVVDDAARDLDDCTGRGADDCALITDMSWLAFREMVQHDNRYTNTEFVKPGVEYSVNSEMQVVDPEAGVKVDETKRVRMIEYWNKRRDEYVTIANGVIIRNCPLVDDHKELPFAVMHLHRRPHTFYSKGIPKLIESLEAVYNSIIQAEVRATKLAFPILRVDEDGTVDPRAVAPYPGAVFEAAKDSIELLQLGTVPSEVYKLKDKIEALLIWITGINYQQLFSTQQSDAVGIEALKKESMLSRVNANLHENEANFIVRIGNLLIQDIMQYYPVPKVRRLQASDDIAALAKEKISWEGTVMPVLIKEKKKAVGMWYMRKIPIDGAEITEEADNEKGLFNLITTGKQGKSYILARPEYIRTTSKLDIQAVRPSAMGSSKEAKKLMLLELSNHAMAVNGSNMTPEGMPAPIWNMEYLETQVSDAFEMQTKKTINNKNTKSQTPAQDALSKVANPITQIAKQQQSFTQNPPPQNPTSVNAQQSQGLVNQGM
jgi:hypothetical protein